MIEKIEEQAAEQLKKYKVHFRYLGVIAAIILFFICLNIFREGHSDNLLKDVLTYQDSAGHYKNKYNESIATNKALAFDNQKQLKTYLGAMSDTMKVLIDKYKKVTAAITTKEYFYYHDSIHFVPSQIPCDFKPFPIVKRDKFFIFKGRLERSDLIIDSLFAPNNQTIVVGEKKIGFFKRQYTVDVTNSNPHIQVTNLGAYTTTFKPKWYERPSVWFATGILGGFIGGVVVGR